jgi:hypothetical protein
MGLSGDLPVLLSTPEGDTYQLQLAMAADVISIAPVAHKITDHNACFIRPVPADKNAITTASLLPSPNE